MKLIAEIICAAYILVALVVYSGAVISIWRMEGWKSAIAMVILSVGGTVILIHK